MWLVKYAGHLVSVRIYSTSDNLCAESAQKVMTSKILKFITKSDLRGFMTPNSLTLHETYFLILLIQYHKCRIYLKKPVVVMSTVIGIRILLD